MAQPHPSGSLRLHHAAVGGPAQLSLLLDFQRLGVFLERRFDPSGGRALACDTTPQGHGYLSLGHQAGVWPWEETPPRARPRGL